MVDLKPDPKSAPILYLDGVSVANVTRFEQGLLSKMRADGKDLLAAIRKDREITQDTEAKLKDFCDGYAKSFA